VFGIDGVTAGEDCCVFDDIGEFAHVAGPVVRGQYLNGLLADRGRRSSAGVLAAAQEMVGQFIEIVDALAKRDADRAGKLMYEHAMESRDRLHEALKK